ncbi:glycosyltransferase family 52 [Vibrio sp. MA40-2]|uniref:glycosyltransferase family 52 n=1 Tax=Vibrio sp. MA40-2 TaxID=3391828 RepID=UPI0039A6A346
MMDLYLCSTLRHFMFALLRAIRDSEQDSLIIMILDQQDLSEQQFDLTVLPSWVSVKFVKRKNLLGETYKGPIGFTHKLCATALVASAYFKNRTRKYVFERQFNIDNSRKINLFLFNDRNRLARLLRLTVETYQVIEDGLSNYSGNALNNIERLIQRKKHRRYIGDDHRCRSILLLNKEFAPNTIKHKVHAIDFIDTDIVSKYLFPIFKLDLSSLNEFPKVLIATQPISLANMDSTGCDLKVYEELIKYLDEKGLSYQIKVHPRENEEKYTNYFSQASFVDSKTPLELFLFSNEEKIDIVSIYSSAGMGFERFCNRVTLINDSEAEKQEQIYENWQQGLADLRVRLNRLNIN